MLVVSHRAMEDMAERNAKAFKAKLLDLVAETFPNRFKAMGERRVRGLIDRGVAVSDALDVTGGAEVARYVLLSVVVGGDLLADPHRGWTAPVLGDAALTPDQKLGRLTVQARRRGYSFVDGAAPHGATP